MEPKLVIPGGSGFLGRTLARHFRETGWKVVVFSRSMRKMRHAYVIGWDGKSLGNWQQELEGATAVVNLAGRSVNCRYTPENRRLIMNSRVESTKILGEAIAKCQEPPRVWMNSSTATIYRHTFDREQDEQGEIAPDPDARDAFSIEVAKAWEEAFDQAETPKAVRKIILRTAMVFGNEPGGVWQMLRRLTLLGLGGTIDTGQQYVSWIHENDFCRAIAWFIANDEASGIYNLAAPEPLTNREMMNVLREHLGRPFGLPAGRRLLEIGTFLLRTEPELVIKSRRVVPGRLRKEGFTFHYPELPEAIGALEDSLGSLGS